MTGDDEEIHMALRARLEAVAEIPPPADRAWGSVDFTPSPLRPHIEADFVPAPVFVATVPARGGVTEQLGEYVVRYCGLTKRGESAIRTVANAIKAAFVAGTSERLPSGSALHIHGNPAPSAGQVLPLDAAKSVVTVRIGWYVIGFNTAN